MPFNLSVYNGAGQVLTDTVSNAALRWLSPATAVDAYVPNGLNQYASITPSGELSPVSLSYDGAGNLDETPITQPRSM